MLDKVLTTVIQNEHPGTGKAEAQGQQDGSKNLGGNPRLLKNVSLPEKAWVNMHYKSTITNYTVLLSILLTNELSP